MVKQTLFLFFNLLVFVTYSQPDTTYTSLKDAFKNPEKVYNLNLSGKKLKKRDFKNFNQFINLKNLDLSWCSLTQFPKRILNCKQLKVLNLDFSTIKQLPGDISQLTQLEKLSMINTELSFIPNTIGELKHLKYLNLKGNYTMSVLPQTFINLKKLEFLYIKCSTKDFISILSKMNKLKSLTIYADSNFQPCHILKLPNLESFSMIFHLSYFNHFYCSLINHPSLNEITILRQDRSCCPWYNLKEEEIKRMKSLLPKNCKVIGLEIENNESQEIKSEIDLR